MVSLKPSKTVMEASYDTTCPQFAQTNEMISKMFNAYFQQRRKAGVDKSHSGSSDVSSQEAMVIEETPVEQDYDDKDVADFATFLASGGSVQVNLSVNGQQCIALVDTGAKLSLCSGNYAVKLQLENNGVVAQFVGLGRAVGRQTKPVDVIWEDCVACIGFYVLDVLPEYIILGKDALRQLKVNISMQKGVLQRWDTALECVNTYVTDQVNESDQGIVACDQIVNTLSANKQLLAEGRQLFVKQTGHLNERPELRERIWDLLVKYQVCWLKPCSGQVKGYEVAFEVEGQPIKQKLRYQPPEHEAVIDRAF
eukprot:Lankesteria_metandrocarpae@DN3899_c0_g1_i1.p1